MSISIHLVQPSQLRDFDALLSVFAEAFEMENFKRPDAAYLQTLLSRDNFLVIVATAQDKIVGGLTVYLLPQYYSAKTQAYIYDFAVAPAYHRQGIGRQLMQFFAEYCRRNGFETAFVQADEEDAHALEFYRATRATRENAVRHFTYDFS